MGKEVVQGAGGKVLCGTKPGPFSPCYQKTIIISSNNVFTQEVCGNYKRLSAKFVFMLICK